MTSRTARGLAWRLRSHVLIVEPTITPEAKAWLVSLACEKAKDHGYPHELWTTRLLARHAREHGPAAGHGCLARLVQGTVCKILGREEIKPHKVRYYLEQRDPEFAEKMAEVLCVYRKVKLLKKIAVASKKKPSDAVAIMNGETSSTPATAAGMLADTAAAGLIIAHGHFLHDPAFRKIIAAGASVTDILSGSFGRVFVAAPAVRDDRYRRLLGRPNHSLIQLRVVVGLHENDFGRRGDHVSVRDDVALRDGDPGTGQDRLAGVGDDLDRAGDPEPADIIEWLLPDCLAERERQDWSGTGHILAQNERCPGFLDFLNRRQFPRPGPHDLEGERGEAGLVITDDERLYTRAQNHHDTGACWRPARH
mgnify:CR=1 FL=1